jgi:hypothetical protein
MTFRPSESGQQSTDPDVLPGDLVVPGRLTSVGIGRLESRRPAQTGGELASSVARADRPLVPCRSAQ